MDSSPAFPAAVNYVLVECGNFLYQPMLDRYIAWEDVRNPEARQVWRNTTHNMCAVTAFYEQFMSLMREAHRRLPAAARAGAGGPWKFHVG